MKWMMVGIIVGSTVFADLLQSFEMKRNVVAVEDLRPEESRACCEGSRSAARWFWRCASWRFLFLLS